MPVIMRAPARPEMPPAMSMASTVLRSTGMPANSAALRLKPTARSSKPSLERNSTNQIKTATATATKNAMFTSVLTKKSYSHGMLRSVSRPASDSFHSGRMVVKPEGLMAMEEVELGWWNISEFTTKLFM